MYKYIYVLLHTFGPNTGVVDLKYHIHKRFVRSSVDDFDISASAQISRCYDLYGMPAIHAYTLRYLGTPIGILRLGASDFRTSALGASEFGASESGASASLMLYFQPPSAPLLPTSTDPHDESFFSARNSRSLHTDLNDFIWWRNIRRLQRTPTMAVLDISYSVTDGSANVRTFDRLRTGGQCYCIEAGVLLRRQ